MNEGQSVEFAKKYLEDLLTFFEVNVEVETTVSEGVIELSVPDTDHNNILIGRNAENIRSMQYLISTTLRNQGAALFRVNIDIAGYKKQRAERLAVEARGWIEKVRETGDSHVAQLNAADRRVVHRVASEFEDVQTFSEGEGRERKIIIAQRGS